MDGSGGVGLLNSKSCDAFVVLLLQIVCFLFFFFFVFIALNYLFNHKGAHKARQTFH